MHAVELLFDRTLSTISPMAAGARPSGMMMDEPAGYNLGCAVRWPRVPFPKSRLRHVREGSGRQFLGGEAFGS
jgi:hypothetical protein